MQQRELPPFQNERFTDFSRPENRQAMETALERVREQFGKTYPIVIDGEELYLDETFTTVNPTHPDEVLGVISKASMEHATQAIERAYSAFHAWSRRPAEERAQVLLEVASAMRERKHDFSAWMIYEAGKSWPEADADTAEAIDFLEYYARQLLQIEAEAPQRIHQIPSERATYRYIPLGVGAVITPWNFPTAILTGMTSAALVAGNTVVLKPASATPIIGYQVAKLFYDAGIPAGVLNFITGSGSVVGDILVDHPKTRFVAFTGSKEVGIRINERAAAVHPDQIWIKRTILEMGGKDAVVVDETADLAAAADGVVTSAFGYQGQKCSAGSRAIFVKEIYDELVERVVAQTQEISVGDPAEPATFMGPVIDESARDKILDYIEIGTEEGKLVAGGRPLDIDDGYFIAPTIFKDIPWDARIAQEEIFGPVLSIIRAEDFDDALRIANSTQYGLTGALYTKNRERIMRAADEFHVGNLYFNRKCTGALVGVQPFGGFNMSGTDSKAGGPEYLLLFMQPKSISEKLE